MTLVPNLFLVGWPKAGTTSLATWLGDHPMVSLGIEKETKFLLDADNPRRKQASFHARGIGGYPAVFANVPADHGLTYLFDATPSYFDQETALRVIPGLTRAPVIFLLREPVGRLLSAFHFLKNNEGAIPVGQSLADFVESRIPRARQRGVLSVDSAVPELHYAAYLRIWREALGSERMAVLFAEEIAADPRRVVGDLALRLGLDPSFYSDYPFARKRETQRVGSHRLHRLLLSLKRGNRAAFERLRPLKPLYERLNYRRARPLTDAGDEATLAGLRRLARTYDDELALFLGRELPWRRDFGPPPQNSAAISAASA